MKSLRYISNHYDLSRTALFKRMSKIPYFKNDHLTNDNGKWLVDDKGIKLITYKKTNSTSKYRHKKTKSLKQKQPSKNYYISLVKYLVKTNASQQATIQMLVNKLKKE